MAGYPRRKFVKQLVIGGISTPILVQSLAKTLLSQDGIQQTEINWTQGNHSGIHKTALWSVSGFSKYLEKYFILRDWAQFEEISQILNKKKSRGSILILEGTFSSQSVFENSVQTLKKQIIDANYVILLGNESAYEQWNHLENQFLVKTLEKTNTPYLKLPGIPAQPEHLLSTLNYLFLEGPPELDQNKRPNMFFAKTVCDQCEFRGDLEKGNFVKQFGESKGCLYFLGCKGPFTYNDCPTQRWNGSKEWCVSVGGTCTGCSEPSYPNHIGVGIYGMREGQNAPSLLIRHASTIANAILGATTTGLIVHALSKNTPSSLDEEELDAFYGEAENE